LACTLLAASALVLPASGALAQGRPLPGYRPERALRQRGPHLIATISTRSDRGRVYCSLHRGPRGFPTRPAQAYGHAYDYVRQHQARCIFYNVGPGEYAVASFHDENDNQDLDRNFLGIPSEGTGFSNEAHNDFGPPDFAQARFRVRAGASRYRIRFRMRY
jgi:uncharacterized protein (DUF2141 family)